MPVTHPAPPRPPASQSLGTGRCPREARVNALARSRGVTVVRQCIPPTGRRVAADILHEMQRAWGPLHESETVAHSTHGRHLFLLARRGNHRLHD
eukprot:scaffold2552_cov380-Prasinococcus_capsulatus_cf.AAC.23